MSRRDEAWAKKRKPVVKPHGAPPFRDMKAEEYNDTMEALGLATHGEQAAFLRCVIRTTWGYSNGVAIPRPVAMLLRFMRSETADPETVTEATK